MKKSGPKSAKPALVPQKNGGALYAGGVPGNKGGTGRPPNELRRLAREGVAKALPNIQRLAENADLSARDADAIAAFNALAKLGVPVQHEVGENPETPFLTPEQRVAAVKAKLGL